MPLASIRLVGKGSTFQSPSKNAASYEEFFIGIDISKEKLNLCFRTSTEILLETEIENTNASIKRQIKKGLKELGKDISDVLVCAEYTGRYIYPLACSCHELEVFLWIEDPTRIKNSFGVARGKNDTVDARRIAEYAFRFNDKAVEYSMKEKSIVSLKTCCQTETYSFLTLKIQGSAFRPEKLHGQ